MPGRLPTKDDFPAKLSISVVPPPGSDAATNVIVFLHGLGDKKEAFETLARQMRLPEAACLCVDGPNRLLDLDGYHWGDDIIFDSSTGGLDADAPMKETEVLLKLVVEDILVTKCDYRLRQILFFGFGQGGLAALKLALVLHEGGQSELGGVVSIGGPLPAEAPASLVNKCKTPLLVCAGNDRTSVTSSAEDKLKRNFEHVEVSRYRRPCDTMPSNRDEMLPVMKFFARRLMSQKGIPEGSAEVF